MPGQPTPHNPLHAAARETMQVARETKSPWFEKVAIFTMIASALITIRYEEIEADINRVLDYCQGFLGVPLERLPVNHRKLTNKTPQELIANYDEVVTNLRETEFATFLDPIRSRDPSWAQKVVTPGEVTWPS